METITVDVKKKFYRPLRELVLIMLDKKTTLVVPQSISPSGIAESSTMIVFDAGNDAMKILEDNGIKLGDQVFCNPDQALRITMEGKDFLQLNVYDIIACYSERKPELYDKYFQGPVGENI